MIVCGETMIVAECDDSRFAYCFAYRYCFCPEETIHGLLFIRYERMSSVHLQNRSFGTVLIRFRVASFLFLSIFDRSLVVSCDEWYFCYVVFLLFWAGVVFFSSLACIRPHLFWSYGEHVAWFLTVHFYILPWYISSFVDFVSFGVDSVFHSTETILCGHEN